MFSCKEMRKLFALSEHQETQFQGILKTIEMYSVAVDESEKEQIKKHLLNSIKNCKRSSVIRFAFLDENFESYCKNSSLDDYWRNHLKLYMLNGFCMQPREDLSPFSQAVALECFVWSTKANDKKAKRQWLQLAVHRDSWHACFQKTLDDEHELFRLKNEKILSSEAAVLIRAMINRSVRASVLHWTPGLILLAHTYKCIGQFFHNNAKGDLSLHQKMIDQLFLLSYYAYVFAEQLSTNEISKQSFTNASYGNFENLRRNFGYKTIEEAKGFFNTDKEDRKKIEFFIEQKVGRFIEGKKEANSNKALLAIPSPFNN